MLKIIHLILYIALSALVIPSNAGERSIRSINDNDFSKGAMDPYVFHQQITNQILAQHAAILNSIASTYSYGDSSVTAYATNGPVNDNEILRQIAYLSNNAPQTFYSDNNNNNNNNEDYESNYAAAAASLGPEGAYQTAQIIPENPNVPNIVNRFAETSPDGFKSVSVSSHSSSSDIDGRKSSSRFAETTINDNGQIRTYRVHS